MKKYWKSLPRWAKLISLFFLFLIVSEIILRFVVGLGSLAVYREDKDYEYFYEANQDVYRFGNHIVTNEYGMRSKKVDKKKKFVILEFGDSVLNGGAHVDQEELSTSIEENDLNEKFNNEVQVLNISAQSWGLSNAYAFLNKHGNFNSKMIVLVFSSHDLKDNMHFRKVVGQHSAWPDRQPLLAISDVWSRFLWPPVKRFFTGEEEYEYLKDFDDSRVNPGWELFFKYSTNNNIPIIVYLHASQKEIAEGNYDQNGQKIIKMCENRNVRFITDLEALKNSEDAFIDNVHLNDTGHQIMARLVLPQLEKCIKDNL
jgi:hypothetical protein